MIRHMAKKDNSKSFASMLKGLKTPEQTIWEEVLSGKAKEYHYLHLHINEGDPRQIDLFVQKLNDIKRKGRVVDSVVQDRVYARSGNTYILGGNSRENLERAIVEASKGFGLGYTFVEF